MNREQIQQVLEHFLPPDLSLRFSYHGGIQAVFIIRHRVPDAGGDRWIKCGDVWFDDWKIHFRVGSIGRCRRKGLLVGWEITKGLTVPWQHALAQGLQTRSINPTSVVYILNADLADGDDLRPFFQQMLDFAVRNVGRCTM